MGKRKWTEDDKRRIRAEIALEVLLSLLKPNSLEDNEFTLSELLQMMAAKLNDDGCVATTK